MGSKLIEICTPSGVWEPCKLQLNFILQTLAGLEWDEHIRPENQDLWKYQLPQLVDFPRRSVSRICIPADKDSLSGIKLVCVADLAINAGGTAV